MVPSKTPSTIYDSGNFSQKTLLFQWYIALLSISSCPPLLWARSAQMLPKCFPNVSQMPPKCLPNPSQMPLRCLSDDSQMSPRSQMPRRCLPSLAPLLSSPWFYSIDITHGSQMYPKWWYGVMMIYDMMFSPPWFFFIDFSSMILQVGSKKTCLGSRAGVIYIYIYILDPHMSPYGDSEVVQSKVRRSSANSNVFMYVCTYVRK